MLKVANLNVFYGVIHALHDVSLEVGAGEIVTLIGANGAGKSTTLRTISGLMHPARGTITLLGQEIGRLRPDRIVGLGIAQAPEGRHLFPRMSVEDNLELGAYSRSDRRGLSADADRVFALFPRLRERARQLAGTLSGGEQQMLAIGRALMTNPRILILDEATEGLAPLIRAEIWQCLTRLKAAGQSILVIDKNVAALTRIADRHYLLERGKVKPDEKIVLFNTASGIKYLDAFDSEVKERTPKSQRKSALGPALRA